MHEYTGKYLKIFQYTFFNWSLYNIEAFQDKFTKSSGLNTATQKSEDDKLRSDSKCLKKAVKILYNRLNQTRH